MLGKLFILCNHPLHVYLFINNKQLDRHPQEGKEMARCIAILFVMLSTSCCSSVTNVMMLQGYPVDAIVRVYILSVHAESVVIWFQYEMHTAVA